MAPRKKSIAPLALVPDEVPTETPPPAVTPSPTYFRMKPNGPIGRFVGTVSGFMQLEYPDGVVMNYEAADIEPADAPEDTLPPPSALTVDQELQVRALWHDGRVAPAVAFVMTTLGLDMDAAKAVAIELSQAGPPPADYVLPSTEPEAPRSLEDQVIHPGEALPRPHVQRDDDIQLPPPAPEPQTGTRSLGVQTVEMQMDLTPEEWTARAVELAQTEETIAIEEARQKAVRAALKATLDEMKADRHRLALAVRERKESRTVEVRKEIDHDLGEVRTIDTATGRVLTREPIRGELTQLTIADALRRPSARGENADGEDEGEGGDGDEPEGYEDTDDLEE